MSNNLNRKEMFFGSIEQVVCKNCGKEADVDTSKILASYPPQYEVKCPHCGEAAEVNTSMVLTSYPPQYNYYCEHCDKHGCIFCHDLENLRIKTATIKLENIENALCTPCLVCGTPITTRTMHYEAVICEDCKKAILKLRKMLED